jgi:hypothetical protein
MKDQLEKTEGKEQAEGLSQPSSFILHPFVSIVAATRPAL